MIGNELFRLLTNLGEKLTKEEAKGLMKELCEPEDDLKLDFTFGGDDLSSDRNVAPNVKPMTIPRSLPHLSSNQGLPASPSTDDLSAKLANTKKLWDAPGS